MIKKILYFVCSAGTTQVTLVNTSVCLLLLGAINLTAERDDPTGASLLLVLGRTGTSGW